MAEAPSRMTLTDLESGNTQRAQFNPTSPVVEIEAFWNRLRVPAQDFEELQYGATGNAKVSFELLFDGTSNGPDVLKNEAFLLSLLYPPLDIAGPSDGAPPRVLFVWPNWISIVTALPKLKLAPKHFATNGAPLIEAISVELEERRSYRLGRGVVRNSGLRRL